jgi:glycosyltransferase involved in cell wall biosynthesis
MNNPNITICVTAYNEEENIPQLLELIDEVRQGTVACCKLIVIDNGSLDSTAKVLRDLAKDYASFESLNKNVLYGGGMKRAVEQAESEFVCILPADNQYSSCDITRLINAFFELPPDVRSRTMVKGRRAKRNDPTSIQVMSKFYNSLVSLLLGIGLLDTNGLPKIFNKALLQSPLDIDSLQNDATFDAGLLALWRKAGGSVIEIPVTFENRSHGEASWKGKRLIVAKNMYKSLIVSRKYLRDLDHNAT